MPTLPSQRKPLACIAALAVHPLLLSLAVKNLTSDTVAWIVSVTLAACLLRRHMPRSAHLALLCIILAWLLLGTGLAQVGAVALFLYSAWALGHLMLRWMRASTAPVASILTGTALWLTLWGALMHFPINGQALYISLCLLAFLGVSKDIYSLCKNCRNVAVDLQEWMQAIPFWVWTAGLVSIGWCLRWAWLPSLNYDDHAMHLRFWTELAWQRHFSFDVQSQIWSVAPFARDLLHAGQSLMAGTDTRSACNLVLALILLTLLARMLRQWGLKPLSQLALLILFASTPMLGNLLLTLQTELFLSVLTLAGVAWLSGDKHDDWRNHLPTVLASAALCTATKLPGAVLGITLLVTLALRAWEQRKNAHTHMPLRPCWPAWGLFLLALAFVALHSYAVAWAVTGNPLFPLYNDIFQSPYAPAEAVKSGYPHGLSLWNYILVFFKTSKFMASGDYTAGWQYLILLPPAALALLRKKTPSGLRLLAVPAFGFGLVMFSASNYWRYMFPVMPVASAMMGALFLQGNIKSRHEKLLSNTSFVLCLLCIFMNMARFSMADWRMAGTPPASAAQFTQRHEKLQQKLSPILALTEKINQLAPNGSRVLYPAQNPAGALLRGTHLYTNWYAPALSQRFKSIENDADVVDFLAKESVDFVILRLDANLAQTPQELLRKHLTLYGLPLAQEGGFMLYRVSEIPARYTTNLFSLREQLSSQEGIKAEPSPKNIAYFPTKKASHALYRLEFQCPSDTGFFIAQINWDNGVYYRRVGCSTQREVFTEAIPIPLGANLGRVYVTSRETPWVRVYDIAIDAR